MAATAVAGGLLPTNGRVVAGSASIAKGANGLTVNQSTSRAILDWNSFSIGAANSVFFNNGSGATLNRVTGKSLSQIDGLLGSTGSVFLINPNGVVIGSGGKVITNGSFVTSTRDLSDSSFLSGGSYNFTGTSAGTVNNAGTIVSNIGDVVLVGKSVTNSGTISAPQGTAALAAGDNVTLKPVNGDQRIAVAAGTGSVTNTGSVDAAAAELKAADGNVYALAGNSGVVRATGTETVGGHIWLTSSGGDVQVTGTAAASNADGSGGAVTARGASIEVPGTIDASATAAGQSGGTASVIATGTTTATGTIKAKGGKGGRGGTVETSGHTLSIGNASVDAGTDGQWLLDPDNILVDANSATTINNALGAGTSVTLETTSSSSSTTSATGITTQSGGLGDIDINSALSWSTSAALTLDSYHSINVNAGISVTGGGAVNLTTNDHGGSGGDYYFNSGGNLAFTGASNGNATALHINSNAYTLETSAANLQSAISSNASGRYALANSYTASGTLTSSPITTAFSGTFTGLGNTISNLTVSDSTSGDNVALINTLSSGGVVRDINLVNASITAGSSGNAAMLVAINNGTVENVTAKGTVIGGEQATVGGVVGNNATGSKILDVNATGTVTGVDAPTGGVAGSNYGTINASQAAVAVQGSHQTNSSFYNFDGGLVGLNETSGTVSQSFATGNVSDTGYGANLGGLVGGNLGGISLSYAMGTVTGADSAYVGGLVGANKSAGTVSQAFSTGMVSGGSGAVVGGLVGANDNTSTTSIQASYFDTLTSGTSKAVAGNNANIAYGIVGQTTSQLQSALPSDFDSGVWGIVAGFSYPYLARQFSGTPQVVAGIDYTSSGTPAAPGTAISLLANGVTLSSVLTGGAAKITSADGYYYYLLAPDTISSGNSNIMAYDASGAHVLSTTGSASGIDIVGNLLIGTTTATSYSTAPNLQSLDSALITAATNGNSAAHTLATGLTHYGYLATGGDFDLDTQDAIAAATVYVKTTNGNITVSASQNSSGANGLVLDASDSLSVNANITINGAGGVVLDANDCSTCSNGLFALGAGKSVKFTDVDVNNVTQGSLALNHVNYVLANSLAQLAADVAANTFGNYALANDYDATNDGTYSASPVAELDGNFEGLGNTISNLSIDGADSDDGDLGLFGTIGNYYDAIGAVRDLILASVSVDHGYYFFGGLVGENYGEISNVSVSGSLIADDEDNLGLVAGANYGTITNARSQGTVSAFDDSNHAGGLVGENDGTVTASHSSADITGAPLIGDTHGEELGGLIGNNHDGATISDSFSTGTVTGDELTEAGGLAGANQVGATISQSYATGAVNTATGAHSYVGGLVGDNHGSIDTAYATGSVTSGDISYSGGLVGYDEPGSVVNQSFATGAAITADGGGYAGGFVGRNDGAISESYAMGSATAGSAGYVGGFAGVNKSDGTITQAFSTGAVSGPGAAAVAGFAGTNDSTSTTSIGASYFDTLTSGTSKAVAGNNANIAYGIVGQTTSQLQSALASDFDPGTWSIVAGVSYPYLSSQFTGTPQVVSGVDYASNGATAAAGASVSLVGDGAVLSSALTGGTVTTGANGYYYYLLAPGTISAGGSSVLAYDGSGAHVQQLTGSAAALDIVGTLLIEPTTATSYSSALQTDDSALIAAAEGNLAVTLPTHYGYVANGGNFNFDTAADLSNSAAYVKTTNGDITVSHAQSWSSANGLVLDASGSIAINADITISGGNGAGGWLNMTTGANDDYAIESGKSVSYTGGSSAGAGLVIDGNNYGLEYTVAQLGAAVLANTTGDYALANDDTESGQLGAAPVSALSGTFAGLGNTIANLHINGGNSPNGIALIKTLNANGVVRDINLVNAAISGSSALDAAMLVGINHGTVENATASGTVSGGDTADVGGLVANNSGQILNADVSGTVTGLDGPTGGLAGYSNGTITNAYATAAVIGTGTGYIDAGGLVGWADVASVISDSYATGAVNGTQDAGGLVAINSGSVSGSYATGPVNGGARVGGLVAWNKSTGTIASSYATGDVITNAGGGDSGGLVGLNDSGTISQSFAAGNVSDGGSGAHAGGLLGTNAGSVIQSYAMGNVSGADSAYIGGLAGRNISGGTIDEVFSTGAVSGLSDAVVGGLIGANDNASLTSIQKGYFDTLTSGTNVGIAGGNGDMTDGVTGKTTSQLQAALPSGFDTGVWKVVAGVTYPYFSSQFTGTPQVVSGIAYGNAGANVLVDGTVDLLENGNALSSAITGRGVSTGANGYYYYLLAPGTISPDSSGVLAYTAGAQAGARLDVAENAYAGGKISGFDIWGNTLIAPTSDATYSAAVATRLRSQDSQLLANAIGTNTDPTTGLAHDGYIATVPFEIDGDVTLTNGLYVKSEPASHVPSDGSITVSGALTLPGAAALDLASDYVEFANNVTVAGGGAVRIYAGGDDNYKIDAGDSISFTGGSSSGATLTIDHTPYTILYSMADIQALNDSTDNYVALQGNYALATSLDATSAANFTPIGVDNSGNTLDCGCGFEGEFAGLGHAISNLTINRPTLPNVGLFGHLEGEVRDLGIVGGSFTGKGTVGALAGYSDGVLLDDYSTANVAGTGTNTGGNYVGGLVGYADEDSEIYYSYATGAVSGAHNDVGGLVGYDDYLISNSFASGAVSGASRIGGLVGENDHAIVEASYATGAVAATGSDAGGLVGDNANQSGILDSYALGAVRGHRNVGGLVGDNETNSVVGGVYSIGAVKGNSAVGGLIGSNDGSSGVLTSAYWDSETSGTYTAIGSDGNNQSASITERTTAQLTNDLGTLDGEWATAPGLLPYLQWQSPNRTPVAITGFAYRDAGTTPLASDASGAVTVSALVDGAAAGSGTTGANGFYYILAAPGTLSGTQQLLTYLNGNTVNANTFVQSASGNTEADLYGNTLRAITGAASASSVISGITTAIGGFTGGDFLYSSNTIMSGANLDVESSNTSGFAFNAPIDVGTGTITINAAGAVTQSAALTAAGLDLEGANANYVLTNASNAVSTIAADTGAISFNNNTDLSIATVNGTAGVTSSGAITLKAVGDLTIASGAPVTAGSGDDAVLSATGDFVNDDGNSAIAVSGGGRWLIYSSDPDDDTFDNLNSADTAVWDATYATLAPGSVTQSGDRYIFAYAPQLTVTTTDVNKEYGNDGTSAVAAAYTITGLQRGVTGAFLGDTASDVYSGTPTVTSSGSAVTATVEGNTYDITGAAGSLVASGGYSVTYDNSGELTVTARPITITATDKSREYGDTNPALTYSIGGDGLVNGDGLSGALATTATTASDVGGYSIDQGTLAASSNYDVTYVAGTLNVTARPITITAADKSREYGDTNPALTYSIGGEGLVNNDALTGALTTAADANSNVGGYSIDQGSLVVSSNYDVTYVAATLTVTARPITITAADKSREYGDTNPALTYSIGGDGLVNGDNLSGALITTANSGSNVGDYGIAQGSLTASSNYDVSYVAGTLNVTARPITITATDKSREYGNANPALTYSIGGDGLVNGDSFSGALTTTANIFSNVGNYGITQGSLAANSNYDVTYVAGTLGVTARPITITANDLSRIYGDTNPALTYSVGRDGLVNGDALSGSLATTADTGSNVGGYAITQGSLAASANYDVIFDAGTLNITARPITIAANDMSKVYGTSDPTLTYSIGGDGLVNGDTLMGSLTRVAGENVAGGPYAIGQGTLAASSNYDVSFTGAQLTIDPATLTASLIGTVEKTYDGTTLATIGDANYSLNGIVGSDSVALNPFTGTYASKNVGSGLRVSATGLVLTGADASNYVLASNAMSADIGKIDPASLTITANDLSADSITSVTPTVRYSGFVTGEGPSLVSGLAFAIGPTSSPTTFFILPHGATAPNYDITFVAGALTLGTVENVIKVPGTSAEIWNLTAASGPSQVAGFNLLPIILDTSANGDESPALVTLDDANGDEYVFTSGALLPRFDIDFTALLKTLDAPPVLETSSL